MSQKTAQKIKVEQKQHKTEQLPYQNRTLEQKVEQKKIEN